MPAHPRHLVSFVRALQTRLVDGMLVSEGAATVGVALEAPQSGDGLIWALVNVQ